MGAAPSMAPGDGADAVDDAWVERAWADGVSFTLLHDEAFVAEKFQELQRARGIDAAKDDAGDALEMTGTDELPMDELERMADVARIKLFAAKHRGRESLGESANGGRNDDDQRKMLSALSAMEGTALARQTRTWAAIERRRTKQSEIVLDYFARLGERMERRSQERERVAKLNQASMLTNDASASTVNKAVSLASTRPGAVRCARLPGASLFPVASFRLQLEMLKAFRTTGASLFENGVTSLVHTVLDFSPFVLHCEEGRASETAVLVDDVYRFCSELLPTSDLSSSHRDVLLILLLALGICSGRAALLIEFAAGFVGRTPVDLAKLVGDRTLGDWIEGLVLRLESYRVEYELGPLTEESLVKKIHIKVISEDLSSVDGEGSESSTQPTSIATDGSYVYTWSLTDGLSKIGTGSNFTVAGRVYAQATSKQYLQSLRQPRLFQCGIYGAGLDATRVLQRFASVPSRQTFEDTILPSLRAEDSEANRSSPSRMLVELEHRGERRSLVFDDLDKLCETFTEPGFLESVDGILFAFYGDFVILNKDALVTLQEAAALEDAKEGSGGVLLDAALLKTLLPKVPATENDSGGSRDSKLMLLYSTSSAPNQVYLEKFGVGDVIYAVDQHSDKVYFSSMVSCGGWLYLSLLCPLASNGSRNVEGARHEPRTLLQISPVDLTLVGTVVLSTDNAEMASTLSPQVRVVRPLFTYVTEGRYLYEVEMSVDCFRVRVFGGLVGSKSVKEPVLLRSFDVDVRQIQCTTYVSCLLKILKRELPVDDANAVLPTFFTNGSYMWMVLPNAAPVRTSQASKFACLMFHCENGQFVSEGSTRTAMRVEDTRQLTSFERVLPSSSCCFDATNNSIWMVNVARGTLSIFKNSGRRIPALDEEDEVLPPNLLGGEDACAHVMVLRVLSFLAQHAGDGLIEDNTFKSPFAAETDAMKLVPLMDIAEHFVGSSEIGTLRAVIDGECLRCCLSLLRRGCDHAVNTSASPALIPFGARLSKLLATILDREQQVDGANPLCDGAAARSPWDVRIISTALALSAQTAQLAHADFSAQLDRVQSLIRKWSNQNLSPSEHVITLSLLRQLRKTIEGTAEADAPSDFLDRFARLWKDLVEGQEAILDESRTIDEASSAVHQELITVINFFLQLIFIRAFMSTETFRLSLKVFKLVCQGITAASTRLVRRVRDGKISTGLLEKQMHIGIVRQVGPTVVASATMMLRQWPETLKAGFITDDDSSSGSSPKMDMKVCQEELGVWLKSESGTLHELYLSMGDLGVLLEAAAQTKSVSTVSRTTRIEVMESSHEYENNLDVIHELRIPGATQITITFDARSRTERSYDYLTFYKDKSQTNYYGESQYSGRDGEYNWPGVTGNPPLVIDSDHCFVFFHSDSSNTDWGYKFTAVGELFEEVMIVQHHWITSLTEMAVGLMDEVARMLVDGTSLVPILATEPGMDGVLHSELLRNGLATEREQDAGVLRMLREFALPPEGSDAARVLCALERECGRARLHARSKSTLDGDTTVMSVTPVNTATRAVCAAIIHHNMWGMDAFALAQNLRSDVSEQLQRGWKNAQKMRDWFHLGDAAEGGMQNGFEPSRRSSRNLLQRQPSAYKGMSDDALDVLSKNIVERAAFLLEMTPMSFSYVSGAKRRWRFLAKYGSALSVAENPLSKKRSNSTLGKWYSLLDELQDATELRSLLHYRRSSSERQNSRRVKSVTEQVLKFIQSDVDITELRALIAVRNMRAEYRACGLRLYRNVFAASQSVQWKVALVESCAMSIHKIALDAATALAALEDSTLDAASMPSGRLHFGTFLSGCDSSTCNDVNNAFSACLSEYVGELAQQETFDSEYAIALLKAMCIDYDADDAYLLQESNVLPQLLRLLASKASRVRRSAQVLLDVLLSRLGYSGDRSTEQDDSSSASHFQKQLFATVGLHLEGIVSQLRALGAGMNGVTNAVQRREHNLSSPLSTLTAPVSKDCDVRWNHSIMLWMYVSSTLSSYSLKIGDEVRRGPSWPEKDDEESGSSTEEKVSAVPTGIVTAIPSPTSVRVKWSGEKVEEEYAFDPKAGKLEVVLASDGTGGVVYCKGTKNLVKDSAVAAPWSHFGLFLNDRRQLSYRIACGHDKECVYETNYELNGNEWAHVAVIQNEEVLKFYVNGLMIVQHILDPLLLLRKRASVSHSRMIESVHPIAEDAVDHYWPVHIPGASKIRVIFDPLSELDASSGFVRFYENARCTNVWGEEKYTGRYHDPERNFPGALSNRHRRRNSYSGTTVSPTALEITADRFLVHFHSSGNAKTWGFRLLATPEFASNSTWQTPSLNAHPFYIGEPPARILDEPAARCWVYQPAIANRPFEEEEVVNNMQASCPTSAPTELPLERALHVIGLLQTCSETVRGRELIATPENVGDLMLLAFEEIAPVEVRCASVTVLKQLCGFVPVEIMMNQFKRTQPAAAESGDFVGFVLGALSRAVSAWSRCTDDQSGHGGDESEESTRSCLMDLQLSSMEGLALVTAYASLFRRLAQIPEWVDRVCQSMEGALSEWKALQAVDGSVHWKSAAANVTAVLVVLGGSYNGVSIGGRVRCCANIDNKETIETGYLLRFQQKRGGERTARVIFDCDPTNPVNVPITDVAYLNDEDTHELAAFLEAVSPHMFADTIQRLYDQLLTQLNPDLPPESTSYKPKLSRNEKIEVLESEHPYTSGEDITHPLCIHGAQEIVIYFDERSCTAGQNEYVSFVKRSDDKRSAAHPEANNGRSYWGEERYYGDNFPGVRGTPPLRIPASSVDVHFHTESSSMGTGVLSTEWGFKFTAHAFEDTLIYAPEMPPSFHLNAINDVRARALKSLYTCLCLLKPALAHRMVPFAMNSLVSSVTRLANASDDGRPTQSPSRSQVFESKHPYSDSVRECMTVTFNGAARLVITFDAQSKTEQGRDKLTFFKDQSLTDRWGAEYSGCDSDEAVNWPGVGDRLPLIIPADSFTLLWVTDASSVDWGWRFTVNVEYPIVSPLMLRLDQLDKQAHGMWEVFYEGIEPQRQPYVEEYDGFETFASVEEWYSCQVERDASRFLLFGPLLSGRLCKKSGHNLKFRVLNPAGVEIFDSPSGLGTMVGRLKPGDELYAVAESREWLKTQPHIGVGDEPIVSGWVKHRTGDTTHVIAIDTLLQNENALIMGVDDDLATFAKPNNHFHLDDGNAEPHSLKTFVSPFNVEVLKGQTTRYQSLAYDTHRALSIKYAREALYLLISDTLDASEISEPSEPSVQLRDFGSPSAFLLLLSHLFHDRDDQLDEAALEQGVRRLLTSNHEEDDACALIERCLDVLEAGVDALPSGRGAMRVLESQHPYPDDADLYWQMSIPGAKKIFVYFDPRSKTEENCDWVCLYKNNTNRAEFHGESIYHGRNGIENWPGFGGRPPLVIDADNFEVYFHSDANQNDWGFKLYAIGVFDEDDNAAAKAGPPPLEDAKVEALVKLMRLSLWLLLIAARVCSFSREGVSTSLTTAVYSPRLVEILMAGMQDHSREVRSLGIELLQQLAQNIPFIHSLPSGMVESLYAQLIAKIRAQFDVEAGSETKSVYLQMLVECVLFVDKAIDSSPQRHIKTRGAPTALAWSSPSNQVSSTSIFEWSTAPTAVLGGLLHIQFLLRDISDIAIKVVADRPTRGVVDGEVLVCWQSNGTLTISPKCGLSNESVAPPPALLRSGDAVSIVLDIEHHVLVLRKNAVYVASSARVDLNKTFLEEGATLSVVISSANANDVITVQHLSSSPLASLPLAIAPSEYRRVCDAMSLLLDVEEHRVATIVECESEHPLAKDLGGTVEGRKESVCIPGALALEIRFDRRTVLDDRHRLRFCTNQDTEGDLETEIVGIRGTLCDEKYPALFLNDPNKQVAILKPGDRVVRSSDWCYADEDGGPGSIGVVEATVAWNGKSGCGVRVRWTVSLEKDACVGVYRYGYGGFYDVQLFSQPTEWDTPLVFPGDTLEYILDSVQDGKTSGNCLQAVDGSGGSFQGTLRIDSGSSPTAALSLDVRKSKLMLGDECTVEFWICVQDQAFSIPSSSASAPVFSLVEIATPDPTHGLCVGVSRNGQVSLLVRTDEGVEEIQPIEQHSGASLVLENQWVHVGVVFAASSTVSVYTNGEQACEFKPNEKLLGRQLYVSALKFGGGQTEASSAEATTVLSLSSHILDIRIWNTALRSEEVCSHANGIDGDASARDVVVWQSPSASRDRSGSFLTPEQLAVPPSLPHSPGSPSRARSISTHQRKWVTTNRTGRDLVTVRADCPIRIEPIDDAKPVMIYYEAHVLSSGNICVGFAGVSAQPSSRQVLLGQYKNTTGLELPRKLAHTGSEGALWLDAVNNVSLDGLRSPRRRSSSSDGGAFFGDVFSREGDVVGCAYVPSTKRFSFYLNGDLVVQVQLEDDAGASQVELSVEEDDAAPSPRRVQRQFDSFVDEMLTMGFSREASEDALEATASGGVTHTVPRAVDWLLEGGTALSSPRRLSSSSPLVSPRRRLSSTSSETFSSCRVVSTAMSGEGSYFMPAATLGAQGAQGIAWNFGQHAFKYAPAFDGVVVAAMTAVHRECDNENDGDTLIGFEVYDHAAEKWERVLHRHRVQEMAPTLLARWKLNEGTGTIVYDSSGRDQVGTIKISPQQVCTASSGPTSPRSRKPVRVSCWDGSCLPPAAAMRGTDSVDDPLGTRRESQATVWGYHFYVIPHFSEHSIGRRHFQTQAHRFIMDGPAAELRHDHQLIKFVNKVAEAKELNLSQILRASWSELAPSDDELVKWPVLVELATGVSSASNNSTRSSLAGSVTTKAQDRLGKCFKLLQDLNGAVSRLLPFVVFSEAPSSRSGGGLGLVRLDKLICDQRYRILHAVKRGLWDEALKCTTKNGDREDLVVNRPKAMRHRVSGKIDREGRFALFSQAFRQLGLLGGAKYRRTNAIYKVDFLGENAQDAGGPYRETLAQYADELHSSQLPLLIASSNAQHNVGTAREKWVLNPSATSATQLEMLEFLGKLMGAAMRNQEFIPLRLALLIWKRLAGEHVTTDDLAQIDSIIVSSMAKIRTIDTYGVTRDMFEDIIMETFTTLSTDNRVVPLKPQGASLAVTFDTRIEFADLVETYRVHEFDVQIAALLRGLAAVVPPRLLALFTGAELEQLVCGSPEVDVDLLQRCTEYSGCSAEDTHIKWFWQVLHEFSHDERSAFLRFVWGRSRLPPSEKEFTQRFKLQSFGKTIPAGTSADAYMPISHTCFFSVEMPRYSSAEVVRERLTYAMYNCQEIDGDGDSVAANQLGWEE